MTSASSHHPSRVFSDTSGLFGTAVARDQNYLVAHTILTRLQQERAQFFTTLYVLAELHALIITRTRDLRLALRILVGIEAGATTIVPVTAADQAQARLTLAQRPDKLYSLTNALSFAVMERLGIERVFTFDRNFAQHGF